MGNPTWETARKVSFLHNCTADLVNRNTGYSQTFSHVFLWNSPEELRKWLDPGHVTADGITTVTCHIIKPLSLPICLE